MTDTPTLVDETHGLMKTAGDEDGGGQVSRDIRDWLDPTNCLVESLSYCPGGLGATGLGIAVLIPLIVLCCCKATYALACVCRINFTARSPPTPTMCYLPPRQHNESTLSFAVRAITPFRYVSEAQFKETRRCPRGAQPHIIHVQDDITRSATLGDQFFTCPTKACTNGVLHVDILLADERDFVMSLYKAF
ncbi:hypothetical protein PM082_023734 [Marasmius tenuissimus]|nr:hypothetical protein PM082_023734 [Marasmius tenuissimus]